MWWVLLWVVLVLLAAVLLGWLAWGVVRKAVALLGELGRSAALVGPVLQPAPEPYQPASSVLSDPTTPPPALQQAARSRAGHRRGRAGHRRFPA